MDASSKILLVQAPSQVLPLSPWPSFFPWPPQHLFPARWSPLPPAMVPSGHPSPTSQRQPYSHGRALSSLEVSNNASVVVEQHVVDSVIFGQPGCSVVKPRYAR
eukprot:XP_020394298.1 uncharacterized protein LOC103627800 isoform X2 [Zea mays]